MKENLSRRAFLKYSAKMIASLFLSKEAFADEKEAKICIVYYMRSLNTHILTSFFAKNL